MRISSIHMDELKIPFRYQFKHASATRNETQSLWVETRSVRGIAGYGESCPREYVTAENVASANAFFEQIKDEVSSIDWNMNKLSQWVRQHSDMIDDAPAAWCAIEMSLLDAIAKTQQVSIEALLGINEAKGPYYYTAVLGDTTGVQFRKWLTQYLALNMFDFKLKLSGDQSIDIERINTILEMCNHHCLIRVDANNLFSSAKQAIRYCEPFVDAIFAIEEPLAAKQFGELRTIAEHLNIKIVLDESFTLNSDFDSLGDNISPWIINLRISKLGGILRSLEAVGVAKEKGIPVIIGAHVGETSLLTRAAITVANGANDILLAQEGGFGTHFLERDITSESLCFGNNGALNLPSMNANKNGLGIL